MHLKIEFAQFCLNSDRQKIEGQSGCVDCHGYQASFHELLRREIKFLTKWTTLCFLFNQMLCIVQQKITKNLMPEKSYLPKAMQKLTPEKPNTCTSTFVTTFLGRLFLFLEAINFILPEVII